MSGATSPTTLDDLLHHAAWAHRLARNLLGDAAAADDLIQDLYLKLLRDEAAGLRRWTSLGRLIRDAAADTWRSLRRRTRHEEARAASEVAVAGDPAAVTQRFESQRCLAKAVQALDEPFRSTVILRYYDDLSAAEIARRAGVPESTVRWRLMTGRRRLRERLDREHGGDGRAWCVALLPITGYGVRLHGAGGGATRSLSLGTPIGSAAVVLAGLALIWLVVARTDAPEAPVARSGDVPRRMDEGVAAPRLRWPRPAREIVDFNPPGSPRTFEPLPRVGPEPLVPWSETLARERFPDGHVVVAYLPGSGHATFLFFDDHGDVTEVPGLVPPGGDADGIVSIPGGDLAVATYSRKGETFRPRIVRRVGNAEFQPVDEPAPPARNTGNATTSPALVRARDGTPLLLVVEEAAGSDVTVRRLAFSGAGDKAWLGEPTALGMRERLGLDRVADVTVHQSDGSLEIFVTGWRSGRLIARLVHLADPSDLADTGSWQAYELTPQADVGRDFRNFYFEPATGTVWCQAFLPGRGRSLTPVDLVVTPLP
jgi:RNA polymerase sigma-70 factor (ECF subfamily)